MIAPNYWVDHKSGNDYFLTVQYYEHGRPAINNPLDLKNIPLRAPNLKSPTTLDTRGEARRRSRRRPKSITIRSSARPTSMSRRKPKTWDGPTAQIQKILDQIPHPANVRVDLGGMVDGMNESFKQLRASDSRSRSCCCT